MPRPARLLAALCAPALALPLAVAGAGPAAADPFPEELRLPDSSSPEGITDGPGRTVLAGSRNTGSVWQVDVRTGRGSYLVPPQQPDGRTLLVGLDRDEARGLVWGAGGTTGRVKAWDTSTGALRADVEVPGRDPSTRFLNDVAVAGGTVWVTDSFNPELVAVQDGSARVVPLTGDYVQPRGFGLNGIVELPGGDLLVVSGGVLYRVDPATGRATALRQTGGTPLTGGDGLEIRGKTLWATYGAGRDSVLELRLGNRDDFRVVDELVDDDLQRPTTSALVAGRLWTVNGKFGDPSATEFEVVQVDLR